MRSTWMAAHRPFTAARYRARGDAGVAASTLHCRYHQRCTPMTCVLVPYVGGSSFRRPAFPAAARARGRQSDGGGRHATKSTAGCHPSVDGGRGAAGISADAGQRALPWRKASKRVRASPRCRAGPSTSLPGATAEPEMLLILATRCGSYGKTTIRRPSAPGPMATEFIPVCSASHAQQKNRRTTSRSLSVWPVALSAPAATILRAGFIAPTRPGGARRK